MKCMRSGCERPAERAINNRTKYCIFHKKVHSCRSVACKVGKTVPSFFDLEKMMLDAKFCPHCGVQFHNPETEIKRGDSKESTQTLQHYNNGSMGIICYKCNRKSGHSLLGDKVFDLSEDEKFCPDCMSVLSKYDFYCSKNKLSSVCKKCMRKRIKCDH